jgi:hypothetical protein
MSDVYDLPGIPDMDFDEQAPANTPTGGNPDGGGSRDSDSHTYVAIDGIESDDLSDDEVDTLEKVVANVMMLDLDKPITGVRVIRNGRGAVEFNIKQSQ